MLLPLFIADVVAVVAAAAVALVLLLIVLRMSMLFPLILFFLLRMRLLFMVDVSVAAAGYVFVSGYCCFFLLFLCSVQTILLFLSCWLRFWYFR